MVRRELSFRRPLPKSILSCPDPTSSSIPHSIPRPESAHSKGIPVSCRQSLCQRSTPYRLLGSRSGEFGWLSIAALFGLARSSLVTNSRKGLSSASKTEQETGIVQDYTVECTMMNLRREIARKDQSCPVALRWLVSVTPLCNSSRLLRC